MGDGFFHLCSNYYVDNYKGNSLNLTEDVEVGSLKGSSNAEKSTERIAIMTARLKLITYEKSGVVCSLAKILLG